MHKKIESGPLYKRPIKPGQPYFQEWKEWFRKENDIQYDCMNKYWELDINNVPEPCYDYLRTWPPNSNLTKEFINWTYKKFKAEYLIED